MRCYAGIGARKPPEKILHKCIAIAELLAEKGYILRSGGADGCDTAFETGHGKHDKQIFLPWKNFNHNKSPLYLGKEIPQKLADIAKEIYPHWDYVKDPVKRMHARNVQQILGEHANDPSDFVICYTERPYNVPSAIGGTMFGIVLADSTKVQKCDGENCTQRKIPVFNLFLSDAEDLFVKYLIEALKNAK
jgi:hypothetical protein